MRVFGTQHDVVVPRKKYMGDLSIRVYSSLEELESLRPAWEELLDEFPSATTFSTWEWLAPWWRAFGDGRELLAVAFFDETQGLVGLAPLQISRRSVASLFNLRVLGLWGDGSADSDNLDIPVRPGYEAEVTAALVEFLEKESRRWNICEFNTMPEDSPTARCLAQTLSDRGGRTYSDRQTSSAIALPETWEAYLSQLSAKERGKIAYYQNRLLKKYSVRFARCAAGDEIPQRLESLFMLHGKRWQLAGERGSFESPARRGLYRDMAGELMARGKLEFWLLELDGQAVAAQFGFRHGDTVFQLQEGFDPACSADSVGYVLRAHVIEQLIPQGVRRYDFLAGESPSKVRWGARPGQYVNLQFACPYSMGSAYLRMTHGAAEGKEWLRGHLPGNAWQVLHELKLKMRRAGMAAPLSG
jgi:CelD/BcsL family acetyltransferase involved in cellulose biosynthesis